MGWRRDHVSGLGKLEGDVQLCVTIGERLQSVTCLSALLPEISHMGKLVFSEKYIKALSVSGERGSDFSGDGEHLAE